MDSVSFSSIKRRSHKSKKIILAWGVANIPWFNLSLNVLNGKKKSNLFLNHSYCDSAISSEVLTINVHRHMKIINLQNF